MVLRGWLFTDLIAPRRSLAARHARYFAPGAARAALLLGWLPAT
jgi:hypothetical protein